MMMTHRDFATILASFLALQGTERFAPTTDFHESLDRAFNKVRDELERLGITPTFPIHIHPIHGVSKTIYDIVFCMWDSECGHYRSPSDGFFYLNLSKGMAERFTEHLSEPVKEVFRQIAQESMVKIQKAEVLP